MGDCRVQVSCGVIRAWGCEFSQPHFIYRLYEYKHHLGALPVLVFIFFFYLSLCMLFA